MFEESVSSVPSIWATMNSWLTPTVLFVLLNVMIGTIAISSNLSSNKNTNQQQEGQQQSQDTPQPRYLARSPSMLQRLKSINFHVYRSQEANTGYENVQDMNIHYAQQVQVQERVQPLLTRSPSMLQRLKSLKLYNYLSQENKETEDTHYSFQQTHQEDVITTAEEQQLHEDEDKNEQEEETSLDEVYSELPSSHVSRTKSDTKPTAGELPPKLPRKMKKSASEKSAFSHFEKEDIVETRRPATVREGKASAAAVEADDEVDAKADDFINKFKHQLKLQRVDSIIRYKEMINRGAGK